MFERYPRSSQRALFAARNTALSAGAQFIDVEHLLVGALEAWSTAAGSHRAEVLQRLGLTVPSKPPEVATPDIPFSPLVKKLLNEAMLQADRLGHHRIRPEHLMLAVLAEPNCSASTILREVGLEREVLIESAAHGAKADDSPLEYKAYLELKISHR